MEVKGRIRLSKNNATDANGLAIPPLLSDLDYGQVAVNYSKDDPCLFFKKNGVDGDEIVKIVTEEKIAQTLSEILGGAAADLDTLKELLDKFIGSDNDVLNLITTIQTEVAKKADKTTLSNHINSTSNPHGVTAEQVGALPLNGRAVDSDKLDGLHSGDLFVSHIGGIAPEDLDTFTPKSSGTYMVAYPGASSQLTVFNIGAGSASSLEIMNDYTLKYTSIRGSIDSNRYTPWYTLYTSNNCNNSSTDWAANIGYFNALNVGNYTNNEGTVRLIASHGAMNTLIAKTQYQWFNNIWETGLVRGASTDDSGKGFVIRRNNVDLFNILPNGKVGIGTPIPETVLHTEMAVSNTATYTTVARFGGRCGEAAVIGQTNAMTIRGSIGDTQVRDRIGVGGTYVGANTSAMTFWVQDNADILTEKMRIMPGTGNVGVGVIAPFEKLHVDGSVLSNKEVVPPLLDVNSGFFHVVNKQIGSTPDGKVPVILIASIPTNNADKTNKSGCSGRFSFYRGSTTSYDVSGYIDITAFRAYDILNVSTGISTYGFNIGTCSFEGKKWIAIKLKNGFAQSSVYFDGDYSGDCKFRVLSTDNIGDWVGIDMASSNINSSVDVDGSVTSTGEVIAYKAATAAQEGTPSGSLGIVYDGLDSTEPDVALSANQGRILNENVTAVRSLATAAATTATWNNITGTPSEFAPTAHNHYDVTYVSDRRLKSNIETIGNGLEHCLSMNPVQYDWTQEALDRFGFASTKAYGMIAQEMELLLPHVTKKIDDHTLSIDYIQTIPFIIGAIKQLHALIKDANINNNTKTRAANRAYAEEKTNAQVIADLRAEIEELKNMINAK